VNVSSALRPAENSALNTAIKTREHTTMKRFLYLPTLLLAVATTLALGQMHPGGITPGGQQPGNPTPGMGAPGNEPGPGGQQQQQQRPKVDDQTLQRQVHQQLQTKPELANVAVDVKNDEVTLEGNVPSKDAKKEAKQLVEKVPGVVKVKDKLKVNPNSGANATSTTGVEQHFMPIGWQSSDAAQQSTPTSSQQTAPSSSTSTSTSPQSNTGTQTGATGAQSQSTVGTQPAVSTGANPNSCPCPNSTPGAGTSSNQTSSAQAGTSTMGQNMGQNNCPCPAPGSPESQGGVTGTATGATGTGATQTPPAGSTGAVGTGTGTQAPSGAAGTSTQTPPPGAMSSNVPPSGQITPAELQQRITIALQNDPHLAKDTIQVNVTPDTIVLAGTVGTTEEKNAADRIAQSFAQNRRVSDSLQVSGKDSMYSVLQPNGTLPGASANAATAGGVAGTATGTTGTATGATGGASAVGGNAGATGAGTTAPATTETTPAQPPSTSGAAPTQTPPGSNSGTVTNSTTGGTGTGNQTTPPPPQR
jgi:osmotically-inducible protein OsmY